MSIYSEIQQLFPDKSLQEIAKEFNYPESTICVLSGNEQEVSSKYPEIYNVIQRCTHLRDSRTPFQYAMDLAASWVMEDYIIKQLCSNGLDVSRAGEDREREFLSGKRVSSNSDCLIEYNGVQRKLELMNDYGGYWNKNNKVDLRDNKFDKLQKEKSLFLGVSTSDKKYLLLNFAKEIDAENKYNYAYHKPSYSIKITPDMLGDLDYSAVADAIKKELA